MVKMFAETKIVTKIVHDSPCSRRYAIKREIIKTNVHYPNERTEEFSLKELRKLYRSQYGPYSLKKFSEEMSRITQPLKQSASEQKNMLRRMKVSADFHYLSRKCFGLFVQLSREILMSQYSAAENLCETIKCPSLLDRSIYPNQKKIKRAKKEAKGSATRLIRMVVDYFNEDPARLFELPTRFICRFLQKHNNVRFTIYGGMISRRSWLDISIANIISKKYIDYHKNAWQRFVSKYTEFTDGVCQLIAEYISETTALELRGKSFANFFREYNIPLSTGYAKIYHFETLYVIAHTNVYEIIFTKN